MRNNTIMRAVLMSAVVVLAACAGASGSGFSGGSTAFTGGTLNSQVTWTTGLGAITHLKGPTDATMAVESGAASTTTSNGNPLTITAGDGGSTSGNGAALTLESGSATDGSPGAAQFGAGVGAGTDKAGSNTIINAGPGTGAGTPGSAIVNTGFRGTTGTTGHAATQRLFISGNSKALTDNTATTFANIPLPVGSMIGFTVLYTAHCTNGTDYQVNSGVVSVTAANKAGTITTGVGTPTAGNLATGGTSAITFTAVQDGNSIDIKVTFDTSLTPTTFNIAWTIVANSPAVTITPE